MSCEEAVERTAGCPAPRPAFLASTYRVDAVTMKVCRGNRQMVPQGDRHLERETRCETEAVRIVGSCTKFERHGRVVHETREVGVVL